MTPGELKEIQERIRRLLERTEASAGVGFSDTFVHTDGKPHTVHVHGIKSVAEFEDDLRNTYVWMWHIRDYLKEAAKGRDHSADEIEKLVKRHFTLQLVSDIANGSKHGCLKRSRSGRYARLESPTLYVPQDAISNITVRAYDVETTVKDPSKARYRARIVARDGEDLCDAHTLLSRAMQIWETEGVPLASIA